MINSLTSFRFITAFVVFLFHCNISFKWRIGVEVVDKFFANGACFMTGFFVLSGFIMTHVYQNTDFTKRENIVNYYIKRFAKIYPVYAIGTIIYFIYAKDQFIKSPVRLIFNDIFLIQGFFPSMFHIGINGGTWSLTVEMFLYFLFPFFMILLAKNAKLSLYIGTSIALLVAINAKLGHDDKWPAIYMNPVCRLGDFLIGIGFYFVLDKFNNYKYRKVIHFLAILLLFSAVILFGTKYQYMFGQPLIAPLFGLWILCVYHSKNLIYNNRVMNYLGQISYSFYIWQFFAVDFGGYLIKLNLFHIHVIVLLCFIVNIIISAISFHFIEETMRRKIVKKLVHTS